MKTLTTTPYDRILEIFEWCSEVYSQHGVRLKFPDNVNPTKTYQWRYLQSLYLKLKDWEFDDETSKSFIKIAIEYASKHNMLRKGLSIFHQSNMLQICYDTLKKDEDYSCQSVQSLVHTKQWLKSKIGDKNPIDVMLKRKDPDSYCNLTIWYQGSHISPLYFALSKSCGRALRKLIDTHPFECKFLPDRLESYKIRTAFVSDARAKQQAQTILQNDWKELCR